MLATGTGDGASAANIPGVVAGLDLLYRKLRQPPVPWSDLLAPAIEYAEDGYELDAALPTTIAEGRRFFEKYRSSARIYLPGGSVPKPGDRFVNKDYAATLRTIAKEGADRFYRGSIARRIAADMAKNGGLIGIDDLAQYRAIERRALSGRYRDHQVYSAPPPVSTGATLDRNAANPAELSAASGRDLHDRYRISALRDRVMAGAGSRSANRRPCSLGRQPRTASRSRACGDSCSSASIRRARTAIGRRRQPMVRPNASDAGRRRSRSSIATAT